MLHRFGIGILALACLSGCSRQSPRTAPTPNPADRVASLRARLAAAPEDPAVLRDLGVALVDDKPAEAARNLRAALARDPKSDAWKPLADLYERSNYLDRLIEVCEARLKAVPDDPAAMARLAPLLLRVADPTRARALAERAAQQAPDDAEVVSALANVCYSTLLFKKAVAVYAPLVGPGRANSQRWYRYSELLRADGRYADAASAVREALKLEPKNSLFHRQLGHILATQEQKPDYPAAEAAARRARELGDTSVDNRYWLAVAIEGQGKVPEAIAAYEDVARDDLTYERTAFRLGQLYLKTKRVEKGRELLKLYDTMSQNEREIAFARKTLQRRPDVLANHYKLALYCMRTEDYPTAIALLRRARVRFPRNAAVVTSLREALTAAGRKTEADAIGTKP